MTNNCVCAVEVIKATKHIRYKRCSHRYIETSSRNQVNLGETLNFCQVDSAI